MDFILCNLSEHALFVFVQNVFIFVYTANRHSRYQFIPTYFKQVVNAEKKLKFLKISV